MHQVPETQPRESSPGSPCEAHGRTDEERAYYSLNERVYTWFAPVYDAVTAPVASLRRIAADLADVRAGMKVLDVATGTGAQAFAFAARGAEVTGVDLSEAMLRIARRKSRSSNLTFQRADAAALPFPDASFDAACISFALHEMPRSVRTAVVHELSRVTRPGGTVVVVDYALPERPLARWLVYHAVKLYEPDCYADFVHSDLRALFAEAAIRVQEERPGLLGAVKIWTGTRDNG